MAAYTGFDFKYSTEENAMHNAAHIYTLNSYACPHIQASSYHIKHQEAGAVECLAHCQLASVLCVMAV